MAGIYDLHFTRSLDDLAGHFGNHHDERSLQETVTRLRELEADDAAALFSTAWDVVKRYLPEIRAKDWEGGEFHDYLERTAIQSRVDPLNEDMWAICKTCSKLGLLQYWVKYASRYREMRLSPLMTVTYCVSDTEIVVNPVALRIDAGVLLLFSTSKCRGARIEVNV